MSKKVRKLRVWNEAHGLVKEIYSITEKYPTNEKYSLVSQIRRAAVSIPANLAEGCERQYNKEFLQFVHVAKGSLSELRYYIFLSYELGYFSEGEYDKLEAKCDHVMAMLKGLTDYLMQRSEVGCRTSEIRESEGEPYE